MERGHSRLNSWMTRTSSQSATTYLLRAHLRLAWSQCFNINGCYPQFTWNQIFTWQFSPSQACQNSSIQSAASQSQKHEWCPAKGLLILPTDFSHLRRKRGAWFQLTIGWRNRIRSQVGHTNRWRMSTWLGTDLLGTSQAVKATVEIPSDNILLKSDSHGIYTPWLRSLLIF